MTSGEITCYNKRREAITLRKNKVKVFQVKGKGEKTPFILEEQLAEFVADKEVVSMSASAGGIYTRIFLIYKEQEREDD